MKTFVIATAFAVLATIGNANAGTDALSANDIEICQALERAHESTCFEYGARLAADALDITGSIAPVGADYVPYLNGMGDPAGLTLSNR
jgi:hypothetical protein